MTIQSLAYYDIEKIQLLQPEGWGDIFPSIEFYIQSSFCFPIKIIVDEKIIGIGTSIIHNDVAWLAHIIVHPDHRNKGIGKLITETLINSGQAKACGTIYLIATDLGAPVYEKVGFVTETEYLFFKDIKMEQAGTISQSIIPYREAFAPQVAIIDKQVSGEDRMLHLKDHLASSFVYINDQIVEGFYLPSFGDGLIIAKTATAGIELMKWRFNTKDNIVFPIDNLTAKQYMYNNNYSEFRIAKRMRIGKKRNWQPQHIYGRIGGNLG